MADSTPSARTPLVIAAASLAAGALAFAILSPSALWGLFTVAQRWLTMGFAPVLYILSAAGLGIALARRLGVLDGSWSMRVGLGLAALLTLSHALGASGLLHGAWGAPLAWLALAPGLALLILALRRSTRVSIHASPFGLLASRWTIPGLIAAGILLAAACVPPGALWSSEFGGFDALSYHLQLPREWLLAGRVATLEHNVYSALPSYLEVAFLHLAWLRFPPLTGDAPGMLAHDGASLIASQQLHALLALLASAAAARLAADVAGKLSPAAPAPLAPALTFSLLLLTPWTLVTGSLAYNEQGVLLLGVVAARAALSLATPTARVVACAILVGGATCIKPTAIFFVAVPVGILLLATIPWRSLAKPLALGALVGALMLAPWMVRNILATSNPVFPFAASVFANAEGGTGWWSREQSQRFERSHTFNGSWTDRVRLVAMPDRLDPVRPSWRGVTNPQWGLLLIAGVVASLALLAPRNTRSPALLLAAVLLAQAMLWILATHVQSRFLLPLAPPAALALAVLAARCAPAPRVLLAVVLLAVQAVFIVRTLVTQPPAGAGGALLALPADFMGLPRSAPLTDPSPEQFVNRDLPRDARLLLLGDATPLYIARTTLWATTYDTHPLLTLSGLAANDPRTWSSALRQAGVTHLLINIGELDRYQRSGFLDPRIRIDGVTDWMQRETRLVRAFPGGRFLVELP